MARQSSLQYYWVRSYLIIFCKNKYYYKNVFILHRLVFSQSLFSLDTIEYFLKKVDQEKKESNLDESLGHMGCWIKGLDYFRLDGSTPSEQRSIWCKEFNRNDNPR